MTQTTPGTTPTIGIGMVGHGFMGRAHSQAWRVAPRFFDLPLAPRMAAIAGRDPETTAAAAQTLGWDSWETDWRRLIERDDIGLIDISSPGDTHAEIAIAALEAGKHVLCEKPLANTVAEAERMAAAAREAATHGVFAMTGFSYRRVPAVALARQFVRDGRLGEIRQVRAGYRQCSLVDPAAPMTWRLRADRAGSGALGDIGAHIIDMAQFLLGEPLTAVAGTLETFVQERPMPDGTGTGHVTVDDAAWFQGRFPSGTVGSFEATRYATGRKNQLTIELSGTAGALAYDLEDFSSLQWCDQTVPAERRGFTRILVSEPEHPYHKHWWPAGHWLGYEHTFVNEVADLVADLAAGRQPSPSFDEGLAVQRVLAAVQASSAAQGVWTRV
ncbi:MAG: Gfo/Idh/MocA family oxidoreductase [Bifidobacteriaceae bacterium]|jgi:predicted dehydrogenase|nr:Gfo/Idh/MocA family oxidoreductase [Bifidobacteriaceae bacterium]